MGGSGVLYTEFLRTFDISRETAMWPFSTMGIVQCVSAMISGVLSTSGYFSIRALFLISSVLFSLSLVFCYWAPTITWITIIFGILFGTALGLANTITSVHLCNYFHKYLATANGISLSGIPIAGFVLPSFIDFLIQKYSLRGAMLILGGLMANLLVCSLLLRPRTPQQFPSLDPTLKSNIKLLDVPVAGQQQKVKDEVEMPKKTFHDFIQLYIFILSEPMFYIVSLHGIMCVNVMASVSLTLVDFVMDMGISRHMGVTLLSVFAISDLMGRLFSGWITDRKCATRAQMSGFSMVFMGAGLFGLCMTNNLIIIFGIVVVTGVAEGSASILINVMYREYMGMSKLALSISLRLLINGVFIFIRPLIVGLFRDKLGSYSYYYYLLSAATVLTALMWTAEPALMRAKVAKQEKEELQLPT